MTEHIIRNAAKKVKIVELVCIMVGVVSIKLVSIISPITSHTFLKDLDPNSIAKLVFNLLLSSH